MEENERPKKYCAVCGREILPGQRCETRHDGKPVHLDCAVYVYNKCADCGMWFPKSATRIVSDGCSTCPSCLKDKYEKCEYCGEWVPREQTETINGEHYCFSCRDDHFTRCHECDEWVHKEDTTYVGCVDDYVCDSCLSDYFNECECCGERFRRDEMRETVSGEYVCDSCYEEHYMTCNGCGYVVYEEDSVERNGRFYCESCDPGDEASDGVMGYHGFESSHYVPRRCECEGNESERLYFGVELECEKGELEISEFSEWTKDAEGNPLVHFEEDGSLDSDGVEAITQPCTLLYHQTSLGWKALCKTLSDQGFKSHNTAHCGLHVHISRAALRPTTIVKMDVFINRAKDFFSVIARRESFYGCGGKYEKYKMADKRKADIFGSHSGRYTAVNTTNARTVEVRIFRGTLRHETILGTIEMLHGLVKFLDNLPIVKIYETEANVMKFIDYLAESHEKYPHVLPMMRRLFVKPRSYREDYAKRIGKWYGQFVERTADENEI